MACNERAGETKAWPHCCEDHTLADQDSIGQPPICHCSCHQVVDSHLEMRRCQFACGGLFLVPAVLIKRRLQQQQIYRITFIITLYMHNFELGQFMNRMKNCREMKPSNICTTHANVQGRIHRIVVYLHSNLIQLW